MGRCYEFGVAVVDGCEHAMVVAAEGGHCECPTCGASCPGQFKACAAVVAQPGYVPLSAPAWARGGESPPGAAPPIPAPVVAPAPRRPEAPMAADPALAVQGELASVRSLLEALLERPDRAVDAVQALNHALALRDDELGDAFDRLTDAYQRLTDEVAADRTARESLVAAIDRLAERLEALERAQGRPVFGFRRPAQ